MVGAYRGSWFRTDLLISDVNDNFILDSTDFVVEFSGTSPASLSATDFWPAHSRMSNPRDDIFNGSNLSDTYYGAPGNDTIMDRAL